MARENQERPLPYLLRLARIDGAGAGAPRAGQNPLQTLQHLDLRGGEFSRASSARLARVFDWLVRANRIRHDDIIDYCLELTRLDPELDFPDPESTDDRRPEGWSERWEGHSFHWIPVPYDEDETRYAWQR
jgi:hypothetical protein